VRAVGLISGGLDSTLAAEMLARQGVDVTGLYFSTGFCKTDHRRAMRRRKDDDPKKLRNEALRAGAAGKFPVEIVDVSREYLQVVLNPRYGYGSQANPCIDCRIFMLSKAREYADRIGARTVFTGEVIGQRPFSQHRQALGLVEKRSGLEGRLLRPLSARHLTPTEDEQAGRIDRERLGRIGGRSRREQEALADEYGIADYPQPSGGCCFLADETYARRFRDLAAHLPHESITQEELVLLKVGRQFRLSPSVKLHVGREDAENRFLERFAPGRWLAQPMGIEGPSGIVSAAAGDAELRLAAAILARYSDLEGAADAEFVFTRSDPPGQRSRLRAAPAPHSLVESQRV
jgi:tRNA U34 2-thiouridine synthase MnmA/TrmU